MGANSGLDEMRHLHRQMLEPREPEHQYDSGDPILDDADTNSRYPVSHDIWFDDVRNHFGIPGGSDIILQFSTSPVLILSGSQPLQDQQHSRMIQNPTFAVLNA